MSEEDARAMLVRGFAEPSSQSAALEYAVEMKALLILNLKGLSGKEAVEEIRVNRLPAITWRYLHVNDSPDKFEFP